MSGSVARPGLFRKLHSIRVALLICVLVQTSHGQTAPVIIDDRDSSIEYACNGDGNWEFYGENSSVVDTSETHGHSTHGNYPLLSRVCLDTKLMAYVSVNWKGNPCSLRFPFFGYGITFNVIYVPGFGPSVNVSIDNGLPTMYKLPVPSPATPCLNNISFCGQVNTTLFSLQNLGPQPSHHALVMCNSPIFFDYALVNQTLSITPGSSVAAICGGVITGVVILVVLVALLWRVFRKRPVFAAKTDEPTSPPSSQLITVTRNHNPALTIEPAPLPSTPAQSAPLTPSLPSALPPPSQHPSPDPSPDAGRGQPPPDPPAYSEVAVPAQARSPLPGTGVLTEDEARYVNGLFDAGAPAPAIANVIQQLISRRQDSGPSSPSPPLVDRRKDLD